MRNLSLIFIVAAASQVGATDCGETQVTSDPGFDLWCGDVLCAWKVERGSVQRVATWHEGDAGVELLGPDSAIEQFTPVTSRDGSCIRFELVSNIDETAEVLLNVDVYGDGTNEMSERLPTSHWKQLSYNLSIAPPYTGIRFELARRGVGTAVVARVNAHTVPADQCAGLTPLDGGPSPDGAICDKFLNGGATTCASGLCLATGEEGGFLSYPGRCAGCDPYAPACTGGQICGVEDPISPNFWSSSTCVAPATRELGESCFFPDECETGHCTLNVCSTCDRPTDACGTGQICKVVYANGPAICGGGLHALASGEACATDDDCATERCNGAVRSQCDVDHRPCGSDASCPLDADLRPTACTTLGVQGGRCQ